MTKVAKTIDPYPAEIGLLSSHLDITKMIMEGFRKWKMDTSHIQQVKG